MTIKIYTVVKGENYTDFETEAKAHAYANAINANIITVIKKEV